MCTIILLRNAHPAYPTIVAANRDELYARATRPPQLVHRAPRILAGLDVEHHGTWMGVNEHGVLVGLTNQRTFAPRDRGKRTRGEVVLGALRAGTFAAVEAYLDGLDPADYNPFNLVVADATRARAWYGRDRWDREEVPDGVSVLPNDGLDSPAFPKVARARALVAPLVALPWPALRPRLFGALGDHAKPETFPPTPTGIDRAFVRELHAVCVHTPIYGTRSATVAALAPGAVADVWFADGPPCVTAPVDVTPLLALPSEA
jgi:uncharacterized protein with NRDE domain